MTTNADIMKDIVVADDDFVNNKTTMEAMAEDTKLLQQGIRRTESVSYVLRRC